MVDGLPQNDHNGHMKTAGVAELKSRLSRYLDEVRAGEELVITDRGVPIARVVPLEGASGVEGRRRRLIRAGLLQPSRRRIPAGFFGRPAGPASAGGSVLEALIQERREGR